MILLALWSILVLLGYLGILVVLKLLGALWSFVFVLGCPKTCLVGKLKLTFSHFKQNSYISAYFFTHTYFQKLQTILLKLLYQTPLVILESG